jgi:hypothetical protein
MAAEIRSSGSIAVGTATVTPGRATLYGVELNGGSAASSVIVQDGGAGGAVIITVLCVATDSKFVYFPTGIRHKTDLFVTVAGTAATANIFFTPE